MKGLQLYRLNCFIIEDGIKISKIIHINPSYVVTVEQNNAVTKIITTNCEYYTTHIADLVIRGLSDVQRLNSNIIRMN